MNLKGFCMESLDLTYNNNNDNNEVFIERLFCALSA